jgi:hypothetical protein
MSLADTTIENGLRRELTATRKALRQLANAVETHAEAVFMYGYSVKESDKAGKLLDKRINEARKILNR